MGAYNMDSHNVQRIVVNGMVKNEGDVQLRGISPYPVAYRSITPKATECTNLLVPVCLSAKQVSVTGVWKKEKAGAYGPSYLKANSGPGRVKFSPVVQQAGSYHIYVYCPKIEGAADKTSIHIFDGREVKKQEIRKEQIQVVGQTSGEWVSLGLVNLPKGENSYVEVISTAEGGAVVADAVLFVAQNHRNE